MMKQEYWIEQLKAKLAEHQEKAPDDLWADIEAKLNEGMSQQRPVQPWRRWAVAAAMTSLVVGGSLLLWNYEEDKIPMTVQKASQSAGRHVTKEQTGMLAQLQEHSHQPKAEAQTKVAAAPSPSEEKTMVKESESPDEESISQNGMIQDESPVTQDEQPEPQDKRNTPDAETEAEAKDTGMRIMAQPQNVFTPTQKVNQTKPLLTASLYMENNFNDHNNNDRVLMSQEMTQKFAWNSIYAAARTTEPIWLTNYEERQHHERPIVIGLQVGYPVYERLTLQTGIIYTKLRSQFTNVMKGREVEQQQSLHYVGIPLNLQYRLLQYGHLNVYATAGSQADWNVSAYKNAGGVETNIEKDRCQWSVGGSIGVSYGLTRHIGIYAEPGIKHYFDNNSDVQNYFKEKPTNFSLQVGLLLRIGQKD